jgi:DNA-binding CsgD family transcriptional regulator
MRRKSTSNAALHVREVEAARFLARGFTVVQIAQITGVSERQVYRDVANLRERMADFGHTYTVLEMIQEPLRAAWADHDAEKDGRARAAHMRNIIEIVDRVAKLMGIELRVGTAVNVDARTLMLAANSPGGLLGLNPEQLTEGAAPPLGLVDPYTFATHEDYCGLNLDDRPMERLILQEFARAGSGYNELVAICGRRSGKGTVGSVLAWYKVYRLLELSNPQRYYGLTPGQSIGTINMANSEDQAKKNVFKHIKDRIEHGGRWFQELKKFCEANIQNWNQELVLYLPKNLQMSCGHSRAKSLVGGTNIAALFDEICKYKNTDGADNAEEVYSTIKASTATFGDDALIASLSSPEWEGDYGMQLLRMALERDDSPLEERCGACRSRAELPDYQPAPAKSHPRVFGIHMATWEANTTLSYDYLWETQNGAANPRMFWREFGARPSETTEGYYPDPGRWDRQVDKSLVNPYVNGRLRDDWAPCCDSRRFVHVDLAVSRDAAGVAMAHKPVQGCRYYETMLEAGKTVANAAARKIVVDLALQIRPRASSSADSAEIDFEAIRALVATWQSRGFPIKSGRVTYDGFQSVDSRQILRKMGFRTGLLSVDANLQPHDTLQELINQDQLAYPPDAILIREAKQLRLKNGRKVDHPPNGGSKDVVDAVAAAVFNAYQHGGRTVFIGGTREE